jgi:hypothetical protein
MEIDSSRIRELIERPVESLSVELKRWIDPDQPEGISKIIKTVLSLRNHGGGYMVIGFLNDTLEPDFVNVPENVISKFHVDKIQGAISRFASEPFEVAVEFPDRDGQTYPVIVVPLGVRTPVASKDNLIENQKKLVELNAIYIRSLNSNNTPSTTKASWRDWPKIVEVCFDNREADIGRFFRRHLGAVTPELFRDLTDHFLQAAKPEVTTEDLLRGCLREGEERNLTLVQERELQLPEHGTWEVALLILGDVPSHNADSRFLNLLDSSNPDYTGWPVWLNKGPR